MARGVADLTLLPFQPMERYPEVPGDSEAFREVCDGSPAMPS